MNQRLQIDEQTYLREKARLAALRARYDGGAVSPAIYKVVREIEIELAWAEHERCSHD